MAVHVILLYEYLSMAHTWDAHNHNPHWATIAKENMKKMENSGGGVVYFQRTMYLFSRDSVCHVCSVSYFKRISSLWILPLKAVEQSTEKKAI